MTPSRYLADVLDQPRALSVLLDTAPAVLAVQEAVDLARRPRVILSGMGSSHYATFGLWQQLIRLGIPAWWVETGQLLDAIDGLVVPGSLLWLTSQSGESAETVAVLERIAAPRVDVVAVTNNPGSTLGQAAHTLIDLCAGDEATVSTKSYLNSLAVVRLAAAGLTGDAEAALSSLRTTVDAVEAYLRRIGDHVDALSGFARDRHVLLTGRGSAAASAQAAGLVLKEAAKLPVEGMSAGALRHGVIELAGPGLAVVFFDHAEGVHRDQNVRLASELASAGTQVGWVGDAEVAGQDRLPAPIGEGVDAAIRDAVAFQTLSFELARRSGVTAGSFAFASKVTATL